MIEVFFPKKFQRYQIARFIKQRIELLHNGKMFEMKNEKRYVWVARIQADHSQN